MHDTTSTADEQLRADVADLTVRLMERLADIDARLAELEARERAVA